MWKRGKVSRSKSSTPTPCCARIVATVDPAGPPPMTMTSGWFIARPMSDVRCPLRERLEAVGHRRGDLHGPHGAVRQFADAGDLPGCRREVRALTGDRAV